MYYIHVKILGYLTWWTCYEADHCREWCIQNTACTHFVFHRDERTCYLKTGYVEVGRFYPSLDGGKTCGLVKDHQKILRILNKYLFEYIQIKTRDQTIFSIFFVNFS